jgi:4-amino-4-deoxy-L-arabinose transferase-like glycosyltransferase
MSTHTGTLDAILRPLDARREAVLADVAWLVGLVLLLVATGLGLRDPWPADEPRFALIARDMVATGNWLVPTIGGDLYGDKPPLYFWLIAAIYWLTGSLRFAFLLPSLLATLGSVLLVYDLGRRLSGRAAGFAGALALLFTIQFFWQGRQAQIDATLCFFVTLSLYSLLRHLLLGSAWGWYALGWAAAGFGVITKGVGFLPLLVLVPYALARGSRWHPRPQRQGGWRWWLGPLAFLAAVSVWLAPMLAASLTDPSLAAYRDEILFSQTVERYGSAWHHRKPFWYFLVEVIPALWLPLTVLLPWLVPQWRRAIAAGDLRILLPLAWVGLVVLFFSLSSGKRGVYVLPALPALALAAGPALLALVDRKGPSRAVFAVAAVLVGVLLAAAGYALLDADVRSEVLGEYGIDPFWPLATMGGAGLLVLLGAGPSRGFFAWAGVLVVAMGLTGFWINPQIDAVRSAKAYADAVEARTADIAELGLVGYREQYLLQLRRPTVNFGHSRWREADQEAADAAAWLDAAPARALIVDEDALDACFARDAAEFIVSANRADWYLVTRGARPACVARGHVEAARRYDPANPPSLELVIGRRPAP